MNMKDDAGSNDISAKRINQVLHDRGWNKSQLARLLGVSVQAVQHWTKGGSRPGGKNLSRLSEVTGKPEHWFFMEHPEDQVLANLLTPNPATTKEMSHDERESKLINFYRKFPESEKNHMLTLFEEKSKEYDRLLAELIRLRGGN